MVDLYGVTNSHLAGFSVLQGAREIPRVEPKGFPKGSGYISPYIPTSVIIQTFSIYNSYTSSIDLPGRAILEELILLVIENVLYCIVLCALSTGQDVFIGPWQYLGEDSSQVSAGDE